MVPQTSIPKAPTSLYPSSLFAILVNDFIGSSRAAPSRIRRVSNRRRLTVSTHLHHSQGAAPPFTWSSRSEAEGSAVLPSQTTPLSRTRSAPGSNRPPTGVRLLRDLYLKLCSFAEIPSAAHTNLQATGRSSVQDLAIPHANGSSTVGGGILIVSDHQNRLAKIPIQPLQ